MSIEASVRILGSAQSSARDVVNAAQVISRAIATDKLKANQFLDILQSDLTSGDPSTRSAALRGIADVITELQTSATPVSDADWRLYGEPAIQVLLRQDNAAFGSALRVLMPISAVPPLRKAVFGVRRADQITSLQYDVLNIAIARGSNLTLDIRLQSVVLLWALVITQAPVSHDAVALAMLLTQLFSKQRDAGLLLNSFTTLATLMQAADAAELAPVSKTLFKSFSDYYPILAVPLGAPVGKEELNGALQSCFVASKCLAEHTLPFLLDKAESTVTQARIEAFSTLSVCVRSYGSSIPHLDEFLVLVASSIKDNGCFGNSEELSATCFELIYTINNTVEEGKAEAFMKNMIDTLIGMLIPTQDNLDGDTPYDTELCGPARTILSRCFAFIPRARKHLEPCATRLCQKALDVPDAASAVLCGAVTDFVDALVPIVQNNVDKGDKETINELEGHVKMLKGKIESLLGAVTATAVVAEVGRGCAALASMNKTIITDEEISEIVNRMLSFSKDSKCTNDGRTAIFLSLSLVAERRSKVVVDALKNTDFRSLDSGFLRGYSLVARASAEVFSMLFSALSDIVIGKLSSGGGDDEADLPLFNAWSRCIETVSDDKIVESTDLVISVVKKLLALPPMKSSRKSTKIVRKVVQGIVEPAVDSAQEELFKVIVDAPWTPLIGLTVCSFNQHGSTLAVEHEGFVSGLLEIRRRTKSPASGVVFGESEMVCLAVEIASLFNKCKLTSDTAKKCLESVGEEVKAHKTDDPALLCWLGRALMMRQENPLATELIEAAVELCIAGNEDVGRNMSVLSSESAPIEYGLVKEAGCVVIGGSYGKRVFDAAFEQLFEAFKSELSNRGIARALIAVLGAAPLPVLSNVMSQVTPFALASLSSVDPSKDDVSPSLGLLRFAIANDTSFFRLDYDRLNRLILRLCALTDSEHCNNAHSRESALNLLSIVRKVFSTPELMAADSIVRKALAASLDDPKKPVRVAAVRCNNAWIVGKQPSSPEEF